MAKERGGGWAEGGPLARKGDYGDPADVPDLREDGGGIPAWVPVAAGAGGLVVGAAVVWAVLRVRRGKTGG